MYKENRLKLESLIKKIEYYKYTLNSLLYWDKITVMPIEAIGYRSDVMMFFAEELYKLISSNELRELIKYFDGNLQNDKITNSIIKRLIRNSLYISKIPQSEYGHYIQLIAQAEQVWEKARNENNFDIVKPYLEQLLTHYKNFAQYWGFKDNPYDAWLGYYEEDIDTLSMDEMIYSIKPVILNLMKNSKKNSLSVINDDDTNLPLISLSEEEHLNLTKKILDLLGFSFERGRIDISAHSTILSNSPNDVRLLTTPYDGDLKKDILKIMYLGGKGVYEQNINTNLLGTLLAEVCSFAIEESIGSLYEDIIGKSPEFWDYIIPVINESLKPKDTITKKDLIGNINELNINPIRLDSDELTYIIHIIIRYELEKDLINGVLDVTNLPIAWKTKYKEYLGIEPKNNKEGVLQDIHWFAGYFGYFASYLFSRLVSAQFSHFIEKNSPNFKETKGEERLKLYENWLKDNIYQHGGIYNSKELIEKACGEPLNVNYYVKYLEKRYKNTKNN